MAFNRPTLTELITRIKQDFENRLQTDGPVLPNSIINVFSRVFSGAVHVLHGHLAYISRQIFADQAEAENLDRIGSIWGIDRTTATFAGGAVTLTGSTGTVVPEDTVLVRSDGVEFTTDSEVTLAAGTASVNVTASTAGVSPNTLTGVELSFQTPIESVDTAATVGADGITGGLDQESDASYRARIISRIQDPPQGGSEVDYETWALEVTGVTRAWVIPNLNGVGNVGVTFVKDNEDPIIPDSSDIADVSAYIGERKPVTAFHQIYAPTAQTIDFSISITPNTSVVRSSVESELEDLLFRDGGPGSTVLLSRINEAISVAQGESDHLLTAPVSDVAITTGNIATLGTITWSDL